VEKVPVEKSIYRKLLDLKERMGVHQLSEMNFVGHSVYKTDITNEWDMDYEGVNSIIDCIRPENYNPHKEVYEGLIMIPKSYRIGAFQNYYEMHSDVLRWANSMWRKYASYIS
tara:strand:- start:439 stop:777 length:339 start_codon:yes stop_codon:yes gene_type:complete